MQLGGEFQGGMQAEVPTTNRLKGVTPSSWELELRAIPGPGSPGRVMRLPAPLVSFVAKWAQRDPT